MSIKNLIIAIFCVIIFLSFTLFADEQWNKQEGANGVAEYASDSGSFALLDGCYFTKIKVTVSVQNGNSQQTPMTAEAYIQVGSYTAHASVSDPEGDSDWDDEYPSGTGSCNSWYWEIDTRNNDGDGSAWCKWKWSCN